MIIHNTLHLVLFDFNAKKIYLQNERQALECLRTVLTVIHNNVKLIIACYTVCFQVLVLLL